MPTQQQQQQQLLDDDDGGGDDDDDDDDDDDEEEEEVPLFTIYSFIHIQASVEVEGVEEQMLIFSSSLTPGRVKGSRIALIWKIPACLKIGKTYIL